MLTSFFFGRTAPLRSGVEAAAVAFDSAPVADVSHVSHPRADEGAQVDTKALGLSRFVTAARNLVVAVVAVGALSLGASNANAQTNSEGAIRTDPGLTANTLAKNDDGSTERVPTGFPVNFFGTTFDGVFVNNNGNISFDNASATFVPEDLSTSGRILIAGFYTDIDTRAAASQPVRYGQGTVDGRQAFAATYVDVGYFSTRADRRNSFQIVLINRPDTGEGNFDIELNYNKVQFDAGSTNNGVNGIGTPQNRGPGNDGSARIGFTNGTQNPGTLFEFPGSGDARTFLDSNLQTGLIYNSFNSPVPGRYRFEVRGGVVGRSIGVSDAEVVEGDNGQTNMVFSVNIIPSAAIESTIRYTTSDGTATAGEDYVATTGTVTFQPGEVIKTFSVPVIGDLLTEGDETFFVTLTSAVGGAIVRPQGTGTIFDEEANTPPVASDILRNIGEDGVLTFSPGTFIAAYSDAENDPLRSVRIQSLPSNGTLRFNNTAVTLGQVITANDLFSLTYTPNANYFGSDSFNYQAFDRIAFSNVARVNINVNPINDLPTISNLANRRINRNTSTGPISFTIGDVETSFNNLVLSATSSNPGLVPVSNIVFANPDDDDTDATTDQRTVTVTPVSGEIGTATITITVTDEDGGTASQSFVLTVNGAPSLADASFTIQQNRRFFAQLAASDPNNDVLNYQVTSGALPTGLSLSQAGLIAGTPTRTGSFTATVSASDGLATTSARVFITVVAAPVNRLPVVDGQTLSAAVSRPFSMPLSASDPDGDTLTFVSASNSQLPPQLAISARGVLSGVPTQTGVFPFSLIVSDGRGGSVRANYILIVTGAADGQGPIITRSNVPSVITRAQLAATTLSGTVRDVAASGVAPSGVNRMLFQLRRVSDGFAYDGSAFTPNTNVGYLPIGVSGDTGNPAATRTWSYGLSILPPANVMTPGRYSMSILAQDNAGNYSITVIYITVPAGSTNPSAGNG